jgi:hypothetical protein
MSPSELEARGAGGNASGGAGGSAGGPGDAADCLEWSVVPFRENLGRSAAVVAAMLLVGFLVVALFKDVFLGILSVLILFASLHTYFGKTTYRLDSGQVVVKSSFGTTAKKWSHFKRYFVDRKGVTLSPFDKRSRLEPFRSLRLLFGGNRDEVVAFISKRVGGNAGGGAR